MISQFYNIGGKLTLSTHTTTTIHDVFLLLFTIPNVEQMTQKHSSLALIYYDLCFTTDRPYTTQINFLIAP